MAKKLRLLVLLLMLVLAVPAVAETPAALEDVPKALQEAESLDEQIAVLYDVSLRDADTLENGGWDLDLNPEMADILPLAFFPESYDSAEPIEGDTLPDALAGKKFIVLYDDHGRMLVLGDFFVRIPESMRAASLEEADAVLLLRFTDHKRTDYIGAAYDRNYDLYAWAVGSDTIYLLDHEYTTPPSYGYGTLYGDTMSKAALWEKMRTPFFDSFTVNDPYGTMTYTISGKCCYLSGVTGNRTTLEIPDEVNGYPVTGIADCDLPSECESLKEVRMPRGLIWIGEWAFDSCNRVKALDFPEGFESIADHAVYGWEKLERVTLPPSVVSIGEDFLIYGCSMPWFAVPDGITELKDNFMRDASGTLCVYIPETVTEFGDDLLNRGRIVVYTPEDSAAARWAESVDRPYVACPSPDAMPHPAVETEGDFQYAVLEGEAILLRYTGEGGDVTVPDTFGGYPVRSIHSSAFEEAESISVVFPDGVTLRADCVLYCNQVNAYLPASAEIEDDAFYGCTSLTIHSPEGSPAQQWAAEQEVPWEPWTP